MSNSKNYEFMTPANLKAERRQLVDKLQAIHKAADKREFTPDEKKNWEETQDLLNEVDYHLREATLKVEALSEANQQVIDSKRFNELKGKAKRTQSRSNNLLGRIVKSYFHKPDEEVRGLTSSGATKMIPADRIQNTIFDLQSQNDLATAGVQFIQLENNAQWPRITDLGTPYWQAAQLDQINDSTPTITGIKAELKDLAIRFIVANQVIMDAAEDVEIVLQQAMLEAINQAILESFFSGSGASGQPTGLDNLASILTVDAAGSKLTNYRWHIQAVKALLDANMPLQNLSVFGSPDSWQQLESLTDSTGQPLLAPATISAMNKYYTSAIKTNYGTGTDRTKLYFGDYTRSIVGFQPAMTVVTDGSASKLASEIIVHMRMDTLHLSPDSFCRVDNIETGLPEYGI